MSWTTTRPFAIRCNGCSRQWITACHFESAEAFLAHFDPREVACLIADIRMDGMSGMELRDRLIERQSRCRSSSSPDMATCRWRSRR